MGIFYCYVSLPEENKTGSSVKSWGKVVVATYIPGLTKAEGKFRSFKQDPLVKIKTNYTSKTIMDTQNKPYLNGGTFFKTIICLHLCWISGSISEESRTILRYPEDGIGTLNTTLGKGCQILKDYVDWCPRTRKHPISSLLGVIMNFLYDPFLWKSLDSQHFRPWKSPETNRK